MADTSKYANWTRADLIARVLDLENSLLPGDGTGSRATTTPSPPPSFPQSPHQEAQPTSALLRGTPVTRISASGPGPPRQPARAKARVKRKDLSEQKPFDFSLHPRRKIALRFTYAGWEYGGLAYQAGPTPLPTVEGVLFDALVQTRLIDGTKGFEGCEWERCGRTDRGVSGAGNVVSLWVRGAIPQDTPTHEGDADSPSISNSQDTPPSETIPTPSATTKELRYIYMLNRVLPHTIRVVAWSPVASTFSSRFACEYRHYKYFFHSRDLDISRIQDTASRLIGEHDFRNLCKFDASKQITNFRRKILQASISPARLEGRADLDGVWMFDLKGTAFLYNQVRHIVAILFLVGAGLEHPSLMTALLNVDKEHPYPAFKEGEPTPPIVDRKPEYQMADGLPLVLWDCAYSDEDVQWQVDEGDGSGGGASGTGGVYGQLKSIYERSRIYSALDAYFLESASKHHLAPTNPFPLGMNSSGLGGIIPDDSGVLQIPLGGGAHQRTSRYVPVLSRKRLEDVLVVNERWKTGKGSQKGVFFRFCVSPAIYLTRSTQRLAPILIFLVGRDCTPGA